MTAACGGGTSAPKFGSAAKVEYSAGLLGAIFAAYDLTWLIPVIPLVGLAPLVLSAFCSADPPAVPTFTQAEVDALLHLDLGADFVSGLSKFRDLCLNVIWYDQCECTSGALVPLVPPSQPAGSTTILYSGSQAIADPCCSFIDVPGVNLTGTQTFFRGNLDATERQVEWVRADMTVTQVSGVGPGVSFKLTPGLTFGAGVQSGLAYSVTVPQGATHRLWLPLDGAYNIMQLNVTGLGGTGTVAAATSLYGYCGAITPPSSQPSPDTVSSALLANILELTKAIQRQHVPYAYVQGAVHPGLTGTGSLAVSRLLGIKVEVTAHPAAGRTAPGNPTYFYDLGWLSVSEVNGMLQEKRLSQLGFVWLPSACQLADHVNYFLPPGVTVTVTELVPEP